MVRRVFGEASVIRRSKRSRDESGSGESASKAGNAFVNSGDNLAAIRSKFWRAAGGSWKERVSSRRVQDFSDCSFGCMLLNGGRFGDTVGLGDPHSMEVRAVNHQPSVITKSTLSAPP